MNDDRDCVKDEHADDDVSKHSRQSLHIQGWTFHIVNLDNFIRNKLHDAPSS